MHKYMEIMDLIASDLEKQEKLKKIVCDSIDRMKRYCPEEFYTTIYRIHCVAYGPHFDEHLAKKAVGRLRNVDGTVGEHWSMEQTDSIAKQEKIRHKADFYYVMNMLHSDYAEILGNDAATYVKLAKAYINDQDSPEGKPFILWLAQEKESND